MSLDDKTTNKVESVQPSNPVKHVDGFCGKFEKQNLSAKEYALWLGALAFTFVSPLCYLGLIGLVAYQTFHLALLSGANDSPLQTVNGLLYLLSVTSGLALLLILLRPFFPLSHTEDFYNEISDKNATQLYALVLQICRLLGIKESPTIAASLDPSVSVTYQSRFRVEKNPLLLKIGLPLMNNMNYQQLAGMICEQLAYHAHGTNSRFIQLMSHIDRGFSQCVKDEDGWKEKCDGLIQSENNSFLVVFGLLGHASIWVSNKLLSGFYLVFSFFYRISYRLLEENAWINALCVCGSQTGAEAKKIQGRISADWNELNQSLLNRSDTSLVDDLVLHLQLTANEQEKENSGLNTDPSPSTGKFIDFAESKNIAGIFHAADAARELIIDFRALCKKLTPFHYRELELEFTTHDLKPVVVNKQQHQLENNLLTVLDDYTSSTFFPSAAWDTNCASGFAKLSTGKKHKLVETAITQFRRNLPDFQELQLRFNDCRRKNIESHTLHLRFNKGYISESDFHQHRENAQKVLNQYNHHTTVINTYCRYSGIRTAGAILLLQDRRKLLQGLQLLSQLQTLHTIQPHLLKGLIAYDLIASLNTRMFEHAEIGFREDLETFTENLKQINRVLSTALFKLPGELKGVGQIRELIDRNLRKQPVDNADPTKTIHHEFDILHNLYAELNYILSGKIAELATLSETERGIEPVRLIPAVNSKSAA